MAQQKGAWAVFIQADADDEPAIALYSKLGPGEDVVRFDIWTGQGRLPPGPQGIEST